MQLFFALGRPLAKRPINALFEQVYRKALKLSVNQGAVHQFSLLAHTVPVSVELDQDEVAMEVRLWPYEADTCTIETELHVARDSTCWTYRLDGKLNELGSKNH